MQWSLHALRSVSDQGADTGAATTRGLRTAAEKTGAWITTRGLRSPAVALIGRAMLGSNQPCIGIAPWHKVYDRKQMEAQQAAHASCS